MFYGSLVLIYGFFLALLFGGEITPRGFVSNPDVALEVMTSMLGGGVLTLLAPPVIAATVLLAGKTVSDLRVVARERG